MTKDALGIRVKPDHDGVCGLPFGPYVYLIVRHDDKMVGVEKTRHAARGRITELHGCDEYRIEPTPVGSVRMADAAFNWGDSG